MPQTMKGSAHALEGGWELVFPTYDTGQLFDLASNIEAYPDFVPGCIATRILGKGADDALTVDNVFGFGAVRTRFTSRAVLAPPSRLDIKSTDGPWKSFDLNWHFSSEQGGSRVACRFSVEFRSFLLKRMAHFCLPEIERSTIAAFEKRARALYS